MTDEQRFFAAAWHNMVHKHSLDSHRVRALNPQNGLRELLRMTHPHASNDDLSMVAAEVMNILSSDPILCLPEFFEPTSELLEILSPKKGQDKQFEKSKHLLQAFATELLQKITSGYVTASLSWLREALEGKIAPPHPPTREYLQEVHIVTGNLLSILVDNGASVESLFALYKQVITGSRPGGTYIFDKKFSLLEKLLNKPPVTFIVVFAVDGVGDSSTFPSTIGPVRFVTSPTGLAAPSGPVMRYCLPNPKRLFAEIDVSTRDLRSAGSQAYASINDVLDLVRFEYESNRLQLADEFMIASGPPPYSYRIYSIPKIVPNPSRVIGATELQHFAKSVGELIEGTDIPSDGRDRIQSAFRLYRVGADTNIFENKLTNWWTATEYLVKGSGGSGGIGKAVEDTLVPVLCRGYVKKLLYSFRNALVDAKATLVDPLTAAPVLLKDVEGDRLFSLFRNPAMKGQLLTAANIDPFFRMKFESFLEDISDPKRIEAMLSSHEQRLRWHVQRLYRARCDIVHSAERVVSAALLCANLEFYLKSTLTALLTSLTVSSHINGPKEFFDRQGYAYRKMTEALQQGDDRRLIATL
ncbi:hypothetical protein D4R49_01750 [bacterium]|nr:MAG: hypothetical protein D4R49_01750 [bacterium]